MVYVLEVCRNVMFSKIWRPVVEGRPHVLLRIPVRTYVHFIEKRVGLVHSRSETS